MKNKGIIVTSQKESYYFELIKKYEIRRDFIITYYAQNKKIPSEEEIVEVIEAVFGK